MSQELVGDEWKYNPEYNRIAELLGINKFDREDMQVAQKISLVRDYVDLLGGKTGSPTEALKRINDLRKKTGSSNLGQTLLGELYQYARLDMDRRSLEAITPKEKRPVRRVVKKEPKKEEKPQEKIDIKKIVAQTIQGVIQGATKQQQPLHQEAHEHPTQWQHVERNNF